MSGVKAENAGNGWCPKCAAVRPIYERYIRNKWVGVLEHQELCGACQWVVGVTITALKS